MRLLQVFTALALVILPILAAEAQNQTIATWFSTSFISAGYFTTRTIGYGDTPVTPVPTRTEPIVIITSILTEPTASRNINFTSWYTAQVTVPVATRLATVWETPSAPPTTTLNATTTATVWVTPALATVTVSSTVCAAGNGTAPNGLKTVTEYIGTYAPFPGQPTAPPTTFPTAVTSYFRATNSYRVYAYTGVTTTFTSTVTGTNYLSTSIVGTTTLDPMAGARGYTRTKYAETMTTTASDYYLAYATRTVTDSTGACAGTPPTVTVTHDARCAPTNLISERDGRGVGIRVIPRNWTFPLAGIQAAADAGACCQLCVDNPGCGVSEWKLGWNGGCYLYYWNHGDDSQVNDAGTSQSCGQGIMEYYGDVHALPRQGSFVQAGGRGCGDQLKYLGGYDPFCPSCEVD
ncbi:hypothetical protein QBC42DRAFT_326706 [Cladorrhinum samala]|uniref:Apple domain-containing protein n=1 Tax=Cladorrhinum samala TaxID=585594 RepID=A0AAV9HSS0_9PEZI|nr:hypothetical protein QBC42DRAFT_326706 [Cladorrhinum samala]